MAKLMARFDMQDRISKKIRTIRGEIDKLERARAHVNKPVTLTMRAKDLATKILKKMHMFVLKDIAKTHTVTVRVADKATKALTAVSNFMKRRMPRTHAVFVSAKDKASPILRKISQFTQRNIARTQLMTILAMDRAMPVIRRIGGLARSTLSKGYSFTVRGVDMASRIIGRVSSYVGTAIPKVRSFTIRAINAASSVIGTVKRALFSIPTLITVTLAAVGVGSFAKSTIGAAMNFEGYEVAMKHWLDGNVKQAKDLVTWMGRFADSTPFSSVDLFPALSRGIGISGGDVSKAQDYLRLASDMAAITPGRTVVEAMEAIGNAQMGEYTMLGGFNVDMSKKKFDSLGGMSGLYNYLYEGGADFLGFKGAAQDFAESAQGLLMTIRGYTSTLFREAGKGILESMKPRLKSIVTWLDNNQDKWGEWKNTVQQAGEQGAEWVFSKLEKGFLHIKSNYLENEGFKKLSFEGKIKFIAEDIGQWWSSKGKPALNGWWKSSGKPWAEKIGLFMGESIFNGIVKGVKEGGKALGGMWKDAFKDPSLGAFGGAGVATMLAGMLASLVLSPLITAVTTLGKGVKKAGNLGKKAFGWLNKEKSPKNSKQPKGPKPNYTMPWTNKGEKPVLNTPNADKKGFKMPKGLSKGLGGLGKFTKGIPVLGTALGALSILTASKEDKAGAAGAVGGGLAGAATGAAVGSVVPGIGTAIGGIIGGIVGSIGGSALGDWLSDNWSSIKEGASATGKWISEKFSEAVTWTKEAWNGLTEWFSETIWAPFARGFEASLNFVVGLYDIAEQGIKIVWGGLSDWFTETVWTPLTTAAGIAWDWISEKISFVWTGIQTIWGLAVAWFQETIWTPLTLAAGIAWLAITEFISLAWTTVTTLWGIASSWFEETVWSPISTAVETLSTWIGDKFTDGWNVVLDIWGAASSYFEENIWGPIKTGAAAVEEAITTPFKNAWEYVSGIFTKLGDTWDTIKSWGSNAVGYVVERGKNRREGEPTKLAQGTNFHPGGPAIVGDGGGPELIRYPNGKMTLSPGTDTLMNLPRGTEVLSHRKTVDFFNAVPAYADGVGFNESLPQEQVEAATSSRKSGAKSIVGKARDIIVQITGENHYHNEMDAEKVGKIAYEYIEKRLDEEDFETGGLVIDG